MRTTHAVPRANYRVVPKNADSATINTYIIGEFPYFVPKVFPSL